MAGSIQSCGAVWASSGQRENFTLMSASAGASLKEKVNFQTTEANEQT